VNAPLTPPDSDLRDFAFMPLDVVRLRDADITAMSSGDEFRCAVLLWCASWHQIPAASLPDNDVVLANLAGFGRVVREWKKVREGALRGWIKCSDGLMYHPVVAEKACEAWHSKLQHAYGKLLDRTRKENKVREAGKLSAIVVPPFEQWIADGRPTTYNPDANRKAGGIPPESKDSSEGNPAENTLKGEGQGEGEGQGCSFISVEKAAASNTAEGEKSASVLLLHPFAVLLQALEAGRGCEFVDVGRESIFADWEAKGCAEPHIRAAHEQAARRRQKDGSTAPVNVGLLDVILADLLRPAGSAVVALVPQDPRERRHRELQTQYAGEVLVGPDGRRFEIMSNGTVEIWKGPDHAVTLTAAHGDPFRKFWDDVDAGVVVPRAA
jgi:hypothetical protein